MITEKQLERINKLIEDKKNLEIYVNPLKQGMSYACPILKESSSYDLERLVRDWEIDVMKQIPDLYEDLNSVVLEMILKKIGEIDNELAQYISKG